MDSHQKDFLEASAELTTRDQKLIEARQALEAATATLERALQLGSKEKRTLETRIKEKQTLVEQLRTRQEAWKIFSRKSGVVSEIYKLPGDRLFPGDPLLEVVYEGNLWIEAYVEPADVAEAEIGTEVNVVTGKTLEIPLTGRIFSLSPSTHIIPRSHRDPNEKVVHYTIARIAIDTREALEAGLTVGQTVTVQVSRWN